MKKYDAVIAGYTCVDLVPTFRKSESLTALTDLLRPGKLIEIDGINFVPGGLVPNTGAAMKKFGKEVYLNGLVGDDAIGKIVVDLLSQYGITSGLQTIKAAQTASSIVLAPPGVDRIFLESPGCNQIFDASHVNFDAVSQSRLFHFGYPPLLRKFFLNAGNELFGMFARVQQMGVTTSLDFSLPDPESESGRVDWHEILQKTLPFIDIFVPSLEESLQMMSPAEYAQTQTRSGDLNAVDRIPVALIRETGRRIINCGAKILLIKAGPRGAFLLTGDTSTISEKLELDLSKKNWNYRELWCGAYPVDRSKFVNASGAGDTAAAAFLSAVINGESPEAALKYALVAGRNNLYCHDVYHGLSGWRTMTEEINSEPNEIIYF